jgi:hypothetical protein
MTDQDPAAGPGAGQQAGTTRRRLLGTAGAGAAAAAAVVMAGAGAGTARAATAAPTTAPGTDGDRVAAHDEPVVAHVHDARTGVVDLYTGTRHVRVTDRELAARLSMAAR